MQTLDRDRIDVLRGCSRLAGGFDDDNCNQRINDDARRRACAAPVPTARVLPTALRPYGALVQPCLNWCLERGLCTQMSESDARILGRHRARMMIPSRWDGLSPRSELEDDDARPGRGSTRCPQPGVSAPAIKPVKQRSPGSRLRIARLPITAQVRTSPVRVPLGHPKGGREERAARTSVPLGEPTHRVRARSALSCGESRCLSNARSGDAGLFPG